MENKFSHIPSVAMDEIPNGGADLPPIIPGSELQLDADISSFYLAWPDESLASNTEALKRHIEVKRLMAGCEHVNLHTTRGAKAGRYEAATVKEYQANRSGQDLEKKARVEEIRQWLETYSNPHTTPMPQWEVEADDSMAFRQRQCIEEGRVSKIMTLDKDLNMIAGKHIHYDTFEEWEEHGYGKIWIDRSSSTAKCKGQGTSFFWAQMLMGDAADNIPGLPALTGSLLNMYKPNKAIETARATLRNTKASRRAKDAAKKLVNGRKSSPVGAVLAHTILDGVTDDYGAFQRVRQAYYGYYGPNSFHAEHWNGSMFETTAGAMFLEQAQLLWILRHPEDHVINFIKEVAGGS